MGSYDGLLEGLVLVEVPNVGAREGNKVARDGEDDGVAASVGRDKVGLLLPILSGDEFEGVTVGAGGSGTEFSSLATCPCVMLAGGSAIGEGDGGLRIVPSVVSLLDVKFTNGTAIKICVSENSTDCTPSS